MSTKYKDINNSERDDFEPDFTLILFEEPEVFLHPTQQDKLNLELKELSESDEQQILITSHSPNFISKNVEDIPSIIRISKDN
jgi:predicted ATP-dependent endonuclease of OLD family